VDLSQDAQGRCHRKTAGVMYLRAEFAFCSAQNRRRQHVRSINVWSAASKSGPEQVRSLWKRSRPLYGYLSRYCLSRPAVLMAFYAHPVDALRRCGRQRGRSCHPQGEHRFYRGFPRENPDLDLAPFFTISTSVNFQLQRAKVLSRFHERRSVPVWISPNNGQNFLEGGEFFSWR